jgi:TetR/AcrR family transcriptional regulator, transcriptional repressor of bet genes
MSPGIVRFYFASKAAMLVASLQFLATEFEEQLMLPVARLKSRPVAALELLVRLYLDPELASPRKVSVWYSFWGEASSRQEYYDICGQLDENFAALVRELIGQLIVETQQPELDPDGIALGLNGVLELLWQDFAFRSETEIDRIAARARCMAYLRSIFPRSFAAGGSGANTAPDANAPLAAWAYDDARLFAQERIRVFQNSWQYAAHASRILADGDIVAVDLGTERALLVRDDAGRLHAFRNSCTLAPHALVTGNHAGAGAIACRLHGVRFGRDGNCLEAGRAPPLQPLQAVQVSDLVLIRAAGIRVDGSAAAWLALALPGPVAPLGYARDLPVAADWKLVVEMWPEGLKQTADGGVTGDAPSGSSTHFLFPNQWLTLQQHGFEVVQVLPTTPGRCLLRAQHFATGASKEGRVAGYLEFRALRQGLSAAAEVMASTQRGLLTMGHLAAPNSSPVNAAWRRRLSLLLAAPEPPRNGSPY